MSELTEPQLRALKKVDDGGVSPPHTQGIRRDVLLRIWEKRLIVLGEYEFYPTDRGWEVLVDA